MKSAAALLLATSAVLAGCLESGGPAAAPDEDVSIELAPDVAMLRVDETATWTATLHVARPVTFTHRGCPAEGVDVWVEVDGSRIALFAYGEEARAGICALREVTLEPGSYARTVNWNGRTGEGEGAHRGEAAAAGTYEVRARFASTEHDVQDSGRGSVQG